MRKYYLGLIYLLMLGSVLSAEKKGGVNSWRDYFPDPVERIYIIMKDGTPFNKTNHEERLVRMSAGILEEALKKTAYKIKDIAIIIHNHRFERKFSPSDWRFYKDLKRRKFKGLFLLYSHMTNKTYSLEDNE